MIYASILQPDGHHADFSDQGDDVRSEVKWENGALLVTVRDGSGSVRLRISEPLTSEIRAALERR